MQFNKHVNIVSHTVSQKLTGNAQLHVTGFQLCITRTLALTGHSPWAWILGLLNHLQWQHPSDEPHHSPPPTPHTGPHAYLRAVTPPAWLTPSFPSCPYSNLTHPLNIHTFLKYPNSHLSSLSPARQDSPLGIFKPWEPGPSSILHEGLKVP